MDNILVVGDSLVYGKWDSEGGWVNHLRKYVDTNYNLGKERSLHVYSLGVPSELANRMENRFSCELGARINPQGKDLVIFAIGANDSCPNNKYAGKQTPPEEFKEALRRMATEALEKGCQVIFVGLLPVNPARKKRLIFSDEEIKKYDQYITEVCQELKVKKIEMFDYLKTLDFSNLLVDVVHPNDEGHQILSKRIISFLEENKIFSEDK